MPPKKDAKGGGGGKYKAGKAPKDFMPADAKAPREGDPIDAIEEPEEGAPPKDRAYEYKPYDVYPDWPGDEEAEQNNFAMKLPGGAEDDGQDEEEKSQNEHQPPPTKFTDETMIHLPPSFHDFEPHEILWLRPDQYMKELAKERDAKQRKEAKKTLFRKKNKKSSMNINEFKTRFGDNQSVAESVVGDHTETQSRRTKRRGSVANVTFNFKVISHMERLENEDEQR